MKRKRIITIFLCLVLSVSLTGCNRALNKGFYLYRSSPLGFRMEYPQSWAKQVDNGAGIAAFVTPSEGYGDNYRENVTVSREKLSAGTEFADYFNSYCTSLPTTFPGYTEIEKSDVFLSEKEAYKVLFSSSAETTDDKGEKTETELKILQYIAHVGQNVYFVTYIAHPNSYDYFEPYFNTMLSTLQFNE